MLQSALNAEDVVKEEALWTQVIERFGGLKDDWVGAAMHDITLIACVPPSTAVGAVGFAHAN